MTLTVGVPWKGDPSQLRRCVRSLLAQTHTDLRVLVIADGQDTELHTGDSRVQVYRLWKSQGPYYARAVALAATETAYHGVVDADDWVDPQWAETLLAAGADAVQHGARWVEREGYQPYVEPWKHARRPLATKLLHYSSHTGIYRTDRLRKAGGYSPAYRIGYDSLLSAVLRLLGPVEIVDDPLYHRSIHSGQLSKAPGTKIGSPARLRVRRELDAVYQQAYQMQGEPWRIRHLVGQLTPGHLWEEVAEHAEHIRRS